MQILLAANPLEHVLPHPLHWAFAPWMTNQMMMAVRGRDPDAADFSDACFARPNPMRRRGAKNFFESILEFLRVEVFRPALKEHTDRFLPFLWTLFFFILFCNLLGQLPIGEFDHAGDRQRIPLRRDCDRHADRPPVRWRSARFSSFT